MRGGEVEGEEERLALFDAVVEEGQGIVGEDVGEVLGGFLPSASPVEDGPVVGAGPAFEGKPVVEAGSRTVAGAEVPLADEAGPVAGLVEAVDHQRKALEVVNASEACFVALQEVVNPVSGGDPSGHEARPGWRADRGGAKRVLEAQASLCQGVQVGRVDFRVAGGAERPGALIVAQDEQHVGVTHGCFRLGDHQGFCGRTPGAASYVELSRPLKVGSEST